MATAGPQVGPTSARRRATTAIILAAGIGSRMAGLTDRPKCLIELDGRPLLHHQLDLLTDCGVDDIVIVTGFGAPAVRAAADGRARFVHFPGYASSNNLATLRANRHVLGGDVIVAFADVLVRRDDMGRLLDDERDIVLLVDPSVRRSGTMRIRHAGGVVHDVGPHIPPDLGTGSFVGIAHFGPAGSTALAAELGAMGDLGSDALHYVAAVAAMARRGRPVGMVATTPGTWFELDTPADVEEARGSLARLRSAEEGR